MTGTGTHDARQFLASVDAACGDLAAADRARLLGGLEEHLAELSAEGVDLVAELGDPVSYAHELRAAAGLPAAVVAGGAAPGGGTQTRALPLGPPTAALPLGSQSHGTPLPGRTQPGPSTGKVLLVIAAVLGGIAVLVTAALLFGGVLFLRSGSGGAAVPAPVVSEAPASVEQNSIAVPDVTALSQDQARQLIEQAGLTIGSVSSAPADGVPVDRVVSQDPAAGTAVSPGTTIDLVVSAGP